MPSIVNTADGSSKFLMKERNNCRNSVCPSPRLTVKTVSDALLARHRMLIVAPLSDNASFKTGTQTGKETRGVACADKAKWFLSSLFASSPTTTSRLRAAIDSVLAGKPVDTHTDPLLTERAP